MTQHCIELLGIPVFLFPQIVKPLNIHIKVWAKKKTYIFLSNHYETWWKWLPHNLNFFTKFHENQTKILDFLLTTNVCMWPLFLLWLYQTLPWERAWLRKWAKTEFGLTKVAIHAKANSCEVNFSRPKGSWVSTFDWTVKARRSPLSRFIPRPSVEPLKMKK